MTKISLKEANILAKVEGEFGFKLIDGNEQFMLLRKTLNNNRYYLELDRKGFIKFLVEANEVLVAINVDDVLTKRRVVSILKPLGEFKWVDVQEQK